MIMDGGEGLNEDGVGAAFDGEEGADAWEEPVPGEVFTEGEGDVLWE